MDLKKIRLFSYFVFVSSLILIFIVVLKPFIEGWIGPDKLTEDFTNRLNIVIAVIAGLSGFILIVSYISLLIQTTRIDDPKECHFFMVIAMFSIIPLCSIALALRVSHLMYLERTKKTKYLINELEKMQSQNENELIENIAQEQTESKIDGLVEEVPIENIIPEDYYVSEEIDLESKDMEFEEDRFDKNLINEKIDEKENINYENAKEEKTIVTDTSLSNLMLFNRAKYLSLKGTNYSMRKTKGKKKIPEYKLRELEILVDKLEAFEISENEFFDKKEKILSK